MIRTFKNSKLIQISLVTIITLFAVACDNSPTVSNDDVNVAQMDTGSPDGTFMAIVQSLKKNDIHSLIKASMNDQDYQKVISEFEEAKKQPSEEDKAQYAQVMGMLTSEGAVDKLMAMAEPQLVQARAQLPMVLMSGKFLVESSIQSSTDIPDEQKENAKKLANAFMEYVGENDILSEEVTRNAITAAVETAKRINIASLDEMQNMSFDDAMQKASIAMGGAKEVLNAYGISVNDVMNSIKVSKVSENGNDATMKVDYKFLDQNFSTDVKMTKENGQWTAAQ